MKKHFFYFAITSLLLSLPTYAVLFKNDSDFLIRMRLVEEGEVKHKLVQLKPHASTDISLGAVIDDIKQELIESKDKTFEDINIDVVYLIGPRHNTVRCAQGIRVFERTDPNKLDSQTSVTFILTGDKPNILPPKTLNCQIGHTVK